MNQTPVSLFGADAGYNCFIEQAVIPELLKVIENSGLSYSDAKQIPYILSDAIDAVCEDKLSSIRFAVIPTEDAVLSTEELLRGIEQGITDAHQTLDSAIRDTISAERN